MAVTAQQAHAIFSGIVLGQGEASQVIVSMVEEDATEYQKHIDSFNQKLSQIEIEASLEMGSLVDSYNLKALPDDRRDWTVADYRQLFEAIEGSAFEALHLCMALQVDNRKALLELVKP